MRENTVKKRIKNGEVVYGTFIKSNDPSIVEVVALAGFDFFVLDNEHVSMDREQLTNILRAAEAYGITAFVRVKENNKVEVLQNLDIGYAGVQVPNVDTPEDAKRLVQSVKYEPIGTRGLSPSVRAANYAAGSVTDYIKYANENTMIISHCETKTCVDCLDEVLKVEGIDVIFIGPMDLSQSYGLTSQTSHPTVKEAIDTIIDKTKKSDKALGTIAGSAAAAKALAERGVQYIVLSSDQGMIMSSSKAFLKELRGE